MVKSVCILWILLCTIGAYGQQGSDWAGPDTASCGVLGVQIGILSDPCPNCCYSWSPAEGLTCTNCKNPIARPKHKTTYKVTVTQENFQWKETGEVEVDVVFGEMKFNPDHLTQGSDKEVEATLLKLNTQHVDWSIVDPALDCNIQDQGLSATLTAGGQYGKIQVEASNADIPGCHVLEYLPVNNGVKDVWAVDPQHPGRIAKAGETLYLVDHGDVQIRAIPNEGGFTGGMPDWKSDLLGSATPEDGVAIQTMTESTSVSGHESEYIAGDAPDFMPKVDVTRVNPVTNEFDVTAFLAGINQYMMTLKDDFKFLENGGGGSNLDPDELPACAVPEPFEVDPSCSIKRKETPVEKYLNPGMDIKKEYSGEIGLTVSGRIYHPGFTGIFHPLGIGVCSQLYAGIEFGGAYSLSIVSDPSTSDSDWQLQSPSIEFSLAGVAAFNAVALAPGYGISASGQASVSAKLGINYKSENKTIVGQVKIFPATFKMESKIVNISNMGETEDLFTIFSKEFQLFSATEFDPFTIYTIP